MPWSVVPIVADVPPVPWPDAGLGPVVSSKSIDQPIAQCLLGGKHLNINSSAARWYPATISSNKTNRLQAQARNSRRASEILLLAQHKPDRSAAAWRAHADRWWAGFSGAGNCAKAHPHHRWWAARTARSLPLSVFGTGNESPRAKLSSASRRLEGSGRRHYLHFVIENVLLSGRLILIQGCQPSTLV